MNKGTKQMYSVERLPEQYSKERGTWIVRGKDHKCIMTVVKTKREAVAKAKQYQIKRDAYDALPYGQRAKITMPLKD